MTKVEKDRPGKRWTKSEHRIWLDVLVPLVNRPLMGSPEHLFYGAWWMDLSWEWRKRYVPKNGF